jgi:hypothetical protein
LSQILDNVLQFLDYARQHPELKFRVVEVGCMNAGYTPQQIAPLFSSAPDNCLLPDGWRELYNPAYDFKVVEDF